MTKNADLKNMSRCMNRDIRVKAVLVFSFAVSLLFFFYNLGGEKSLFFVGILMFLLSIFVFSEEENFLMISFLIPNLFMFKQMGTESALLGYFFVLVSMKTLAKNYHKNLKIDLFFAAHVAFVLLTCVLYDDTTLGISLIRFCFNFSLFAYSASFFSERREIDYAVKMYFIGTIVAIGMGMIYLSLFDALYSGLFSGINSGRNYFGAVISPAITIAILYLAERNISVSDGILYSATIVFCLISIILSGSRTSLLALSIPLILILYYFFKYIPRRKLTTKVLPMGILVVLLVFFVYYNFKDSLFELLARFEEEDVKTGNRRFVLWEYYFNQTFRTPVTLLLGNASNSQTEFVEHNTILQCLYELGAIGLVTMFGILKHTFRKILKGRKVEFVNWFPLLAIIFPYCGINGLYSDQLSFLIILCALIMRTSSEKEWRKKIRG